MDGEALAMNNLRNCSASDSLTLVGARWKSALSGLSLEIRRISVVLFQERREQIMAPGEESRCVHCLEKYSFMEARLAFVRMEDLVSNSLVIRSSTTSMVVEVGDGGE